MAIFDEGLLAKAQHLLELAKKRKVKVITAESCTAGLISALISEASGASEVLEGGFIVYSREAKCKLLGVDPEILRKHGAISKETAESMAKGALISSGANLSVAVTGLAGPKGEEGKPVGLVYIASYSMLEDRLLSYECRFKGGRGDIRLLAADKALDILIEQL